MVLAELPGSIALLLQRAGECRGFVRYADVGPSLTYRCQAGTDRQLAGDEVGSPRRAARLGVVIGEHHALRRQLVEVWRLAGHHSAVISADVEPADIVTHDDEYVRPLTARRLLRLRQCL